MFSGPSTGPPIHLRFSCSSNVPLLQPSAASPVAPSRASSTWTNYENKMHPPLTLHRHPMCAEIIEEFQKCHLDHPVKKFFGECTDLKIKLDRCFRAEKAVKRKANFEESKKMRERLQAYRKETAENGP